MWRQYSNFILPSTQIFVPRLGHYSFLTLNMFKGTRGGLEDPALAMGTTNEEAESFLRDNDPGQTLRDLPSAKALWPWVLSTGFFAMLSLSLLAFQVVPTEFGTYEIGFDTELGRTLFYSSPHLDYSNIADDFESVGLEPARKVIALEKRQFHGGITVNETGDFNLNSDPRGIKYTGHPTRELDAAWDELVGKS